jgi:hypothetical protein
MPERWRKKTFSMMQNAFCMLCCYTLTGTREECAMTRAAKLLIVLQETKRVMIGCLDDVISPDDVF